MSSSHTNPPVDLSSVATAAAQTTMQTDVSAILVDTGTTIPGTITTLQSTASSILTDTTGLDTYLDRVRPLVAMEHADVWASTASGTLVSAGLAITCPNYGGETFMVVATANCGNTAANGGCQIGLTGSVLGAPGNLTVVLDDHAANWFEQGVTQRGGFGPNETVTLGLARMAAGNATIRGTIAMFVYQETAI